MVRIESYYLDCLPQPPRTDMAVVSTDAALEANSKIADWQRLAAGRVEYLGLENE